MTALKIQPIKLSKNKAITGIARPLKEFQNHDIIQRSNYIDTKMKSIKISKQFSRICDKLCENLQFMMDSNKFSLSLLLFSLIFTTLGLLSLQAEETRGLKEELPPQEIQAKKGKQYLFAIGIDSYQY